jgi:phage terminase small subunit
MSLTPKQVRFVEVYAGDAQRAAIEAGYPAHTAKQAGCRLMRNAEIVEAIRAREAPARKARIASREQRQAFWTRIMRSKACEIRDRLKASELLGRSEADFTDNIKGSGGMVVQVVNPYGLPPPADDGSKDGDGDTG